MRTMEPLAAKRHDMIPVTPVAALRDNYIWLVHGHDPRKVAIVDPGDDAPVKQALSARDLEPVAILVTHRHADHTAGIPALLRHYDLPVYGPAREAHDVVTHPLADGDRCTPPGLGLSFDILALPGHTKGHIAFHGAGLLLCGDTLFSAGCGRLFEGTAEELHASLMRLKALPDETLVCCGHEYTLANLAFGRRVEPDNAALRNWQQEAEALRAAGRPTLPTTLGLEKAVNVFLRCDRPAVRRAVADWCGEPMNDTVRTFAALRRWKDEF